MWTASPRLPEPKAPPAAGPEQGGDGRRGCGPQPGCCHTAGLGAGIPGPTTTPPPGQELGRLSAGCGCWGGEPAPSPGGETLLVCALKLLPAETQAYGCGWRGGVFGWRARLPLPFACSVCLFLRRLQLPQLVPWGSESEATSEPLWTLRNSEMRTVLYPACPAVS